MEPKRKYKRISDNECSKAVFSHDAFVNGDSYLPRETMSAKSTALILVCFLQIYIVNGQITCERQMTVEWRVEPKPNIIKWTLRENICSDFYKECWNMDKSVIGDISEEQNLHVPQICPLQLQLGDSLFISSEPSFQLLGMNLANVSEEEFINCPKTGVLQEQLIFVCQVRWLHQVDPKWLGVGTHYFSEQHQKGPQLCNKGLRLNVTVKQQLCQQAPHAPLCSGHGRCLSHVWEDAYNCHCFPQYSGRFCQKFDMCSTKPCHNNASCTEVPQLPGDSYQCTCPPQFSGKNCTEIVGQCQPHTCFNGNCSNVTPNTFLCECDRGFTGPFCEEPDDPCASQPCLNGGICQYNQSGYVCDCPAGFLGHNCEVDINECSSTPCRNRGICIDLPNDVKCICLPMFTGKFCERVLNPCELSPCLNNATCVEQQQSYDCRCMPGFTGKNCEEVIDYCRLLSINCLNEGLCLNIIGGFTCLCVPGWTGEFCQFVENACLIYPYNCSNGATCIDMSQLREQPLFQCLCPHGFTGEFCEVQVDNCGSSSCENGGTCVSYEDHYKCTCPVGFEGERCELDIDACLLYNISCAPGALCMDKSHGFNYTCLSPCIGNAEVCANGGSCFHDKGNQRSHCVCALGWTGQTCLENINDCEINQCQHGATCEDGINKYRCTCPPGYTGTFCELDIDNCIGNQCSEYGVCQNHLNSYSCHCMLGYEGPFCEVEINECSSLPCKNGATCMNLIGHFSCRCAAGFKGETCSVRVNECLDRPCWNGGTCEEDINGFKCNCPFGFSGQYCEIEMNECDSAPCLNGAVCQNDVNSYVCFCPEGFEGLNCEINFDECIYGFCKSNSTCLDLVADYSCVCPPGFTDKNCSTDIDECALKPCKNGGHCHDLTGEFYCSCLPGFTGQFCEADVAGCLSQPCGASSICNDTAGGYLCFCAPGFIGNNCEIEVDECLSDPCHNGATCVDHLNAFRCLCQHGFQGTTCETNINECHSSPCLHNATCADLIDGYKCICLPGFTGARCETDIDECASFPCKNGATCIDQPGNYFCQCVAPFKEIYTGSNCEFRPCEASNPCENGAVCTEEMNLDIFPLGFQCECVKGFAGPRCEINVNECSSNPCLHGYCYDIVNGFYCLCNPGYAGLKCDQDIDDCITNACEHNSTCIDLHLRYQCACLPGWEGTFCEYESNECMTEPCKNNGTCTDLFNSYRCTCTAGWTGPDCSEDINECDSEPCLNGAICYESVIQGQFVCICPPFYTGDFCHQHFNPCDLSYNPCINNSTCLAQVDGNPLCICETGFEGTYCEVNTDECASHPCQHQSLCVDGVNHYRCSCQHGFTGTLCEVEINECLSRPCKNNGTCLDLINRFLCNCAPGYYGSLCEMDVNECETLPCLHGGSCINRLGGYQCFCPPGFTGDRCEVNIDECISTPCLNNGSCIDDISSYKCHCKRGFVGTKCEMNVNECLPDPCLHGRCIDLIDGYQCSCESGWTSSRCEININECESFPCINGGSCQDLDNAFVCTCLNGYTGKFCEVDIDVCSEPALNSALCYNGGICVDGPGRTFHCRCLAGFSGQFCEIEVNECNSSPCLHGSTCEDHINGYTCKCQQGWEGLHCELDVDECISSPCIHGICVQREPSFGYTCFCKPGFVGRSCELNYNDCLIQSCSIGFLCIDEINNITCLPTIPQSKLTVTEMAEGFPTEILDNDLSSALSVSTELWSKQATPDFHAGEVSQGLKKTGILSCEILLTNNLAKLSYGLGGLIVTGESSAVFRIATSTDVLSSQFLSSVVQVSVKIKANITPVPYVATGTSIELMSVVLSQNGYDTASLITSSLMAHTVFPTQVSSLQRHQTFALSTTDMSAVISSIPGAEIELNSHSLLSHRLQFTTTTSAASVLSRLLQKSLGELSDVFSVSEECWRLPSSSITPHSTTKTFISKQISFPSSLVMHKTQMQTSLPSEYLAVAASSINQRLSNIKSQSADSLSELTQIYATCSMTGLKPSDEFLDQVLHSKQSPFYETFWMNSVMLSSWYTLMGATTITSGYLFSSSSKIIPSVEFTKLSSLHPTTGNTHASLTGGSVLPLSSQESDTHFPCFDTDCVTIFPSQAISLEPSFSTCTSFQEIHTDVTKRLTAIEQLTTEEIQQSLESEAYDPFMEIHHLIIKSEGTSLDVQLTCVFQELLSNHIVNSISEFKTHLLINPHETLKILSKTIQSSVLASHLLSTKTSGLDLLIEYPEKFSFLESPSDELPHFILSGQTLSVQAQILKMLVTKHLSSHTSYLALSSALQGVSNTVLERMKWTDHTAVHDKELLMSLNTPLPKLHSVSELDSASGLYQLIKSDFSYTRYYGDSYLEFQGLHLNTQNFIHLEFKTYNPHGLLLYIEQSPTVGRFLIQLFIKNGTLQYQFLCDEAAEVRNINTTARVDDGHSYKVQIRQGMVPCEAEMSVLGISTKTSVPSNFWSSSYRLETGSIFVGGLPHPYAIKQMPGPAYNFTGCVEVIEINNVGPFNFSNAVGRNNVDNCRIPVPTHLSTAFPMVAADTSELPEPVVPSLISPELPPVCQEGLCHNGGTCHPTYLPTGATSFQCDCPLHFTGRFCEKDATVFFPSFSGNSYLELPSLISVSETRTASGQETSSLTTLYLTVKTTALNGTILYTGEKNFGEQFLHLYLLEGRPTVRFSCGQSQNILTVSINQSISRGILIPITISYMLPVGSPGGYCMIEMSADGNPPVQHRLSLSYQASQITFGSIFLGNVPVHAEVHRCAGQIHGYKGCVRDFQINNKELFIIDEALGGRNVENCNVPICDYNPCHNGGTCTSDAEDWFCECPKLYSGKLCQFMACDENPCGNGATCFPKSKQDAVCLCPYGRSGILCKDAINISQPSFSGTDVFGHTSFLAYSAIPDITFYYEFRLKFQLVNHRSALQDNLIFFTGQKGHGLSGDDFLVLGLRNGRVVYSYNLGSGTASIISKPLDLTLRIHVIYLGRSLQKGWLKVDDQKNKTVTSPGGLVGLNVFSQFYLGGYREYTPELLPKGSRFKNSFQGCVFDVQVRTDKNQEFKSPGTPEGHPNAGRSVGQCKDSPCSLIKCRNGGKCIESGSTVYCDCLTGWKGAFCTETISICDPEHDPPHLCKQGGTCVPLPNGYTCHCPLGTAGNYCEQAISISDPSFRSNESSWMSFAPFYIRHKTHIKLQFQPLSPEGILFYTAQRLSTQSGDFLCISLVNGFIQLRYNLGDKTVILQTFQKVHTNGNTWHSLRAGRVGNEGYLDLDGVNITQKATAGMNALDAHTDFFVGGVSSLNLVNSMATENEPIGFSGCIREILINNRELKLTVTDPKDGANVGDCDGTACGYTVCKNNGTCQVEDSGFSCSCPQQWIGNTCEQSIYCSQNRCGSQALCIPQPVLFSYICICALGWSGKYCDNKITFFTAKFVGSSYIKYIDPHYGKRDLQHSSISLNFTTSRAEGLILWMGKAEDEDNDFLALGIANGTLKIVVNLGERISVPLIYSKYSICCGRWHIVTIAQNQTCIKVYLDEDLILFEDIDPQRKYTALNYGGICYFGGFEIGKEVNLVTAGLFQQEFIGRIKDVVLFQDSKKIQLMKAEGYNIYNGDDGN